MRTIAVLAAAAAVASLAFDQATAQSGSVARGCKDDIVKSCAGKPHDGSVRVCLEQAYDQVSAACKKALDNTGGGRGKRLGKGQGQGQGKGKAS